MNIRELGSLYRPTYTYRGRLCVASIWWWRRPAEHGGGRRCTGCRDEAAARKWVLAQLVEPGPETRLPKPTVAEMLDSLDARLVLAGNPRTLSTVRARLRYLRAAFGPRKATTVHADDVTAYAAQRRQDGAAVDTVNAELAWLARSFRLAYRAGRLTLADIPPIDRLRGAVHRTGTLSRGELEAILGHLPGEVRPIIETIYWSGWRESEILGLAWDRVRLPSGPDLGEIRVDRHKTGERVGSRRLCFYADSALAGILRAAWARRTFGPWVFQLRAGKAINRSTLQRHWRSACRAVGLPDARIIHDLRRTATRDLDQSGVSPFAGMAVTGHEDVRTYQRYRVVSPVDQAESIRKLEAHRAGEPIQQRLLPFVRGS